MSARAREHVTRPLIVCFAGDVWDGNPHSRHHLMRRYARGDWEVLFVEGVPMRSFTRGDGHELRRAMSKVRAGAGVRTVEDHLHVLRPVPVPPAGRLGRKAQVTALAVEVAVARRRLGLGAPALSWFSLPIAAPLAGRLGERASVLYYQDRYHEFSHVDSSYLRSCLETLVARCGLAIASAEPLGDDLRSLGADPVVVRHGVDIEHFTEAGPPPADISQLERPLIGCVGLVDDHLDFAALRAVADDLERGTVVLVGGVNTDPGVLAHPRIALLGRRPYTAMPAYVHAFDACLVPFVKTRLTAAVNPIKLREYLAAGRPTVATDLPEVEPYGDVVLRASDATGWPAAVTEALRDDDSEARKRRRARVATESWGSVAASIEALIRRLLAVAR